MNKHERWKKLMTSMRVTPSRKWADLTPGESLRFSREYNEMSQSELARRSGITQSTISAMERGVVSIGALTAAKLARVLHVHPAVILYPNWSESA
jgi:transcriptional regulator with XRE-family HTH domain